MGVKLISRCGSEFFAANDHYRRALWLAQDFGWEPAGVEHPEEDFDSWNYLSNNGQKITTEDAANISSAIKNALDDIPDEDQQNGRPDDELNPLEFFSGAFKDWLKQFAGFCAAGSFKVY